MAFVCLLINSKSKLKFRLERFVNATPDIRIYKLPQITHSPDRLRVYPLVNFIHRTKQVIKMKTFQPTPYKSKTSNTAIYTVLCTLVFALLTVANNPLAAQCAETDQLNFTTLNGSTNPVIDINAAEMTLGGGRVLASRYFSGNATEDEYFIHDFHLNGSVGPHIGLFNSAGADDNVNFTFYFANDLEELDFRLLDIDRHDEIIVNAIYNGEVIPIRAENYNIPGINPCAEYMDGNRFKSSCFGTNLDNSIEGVVDFSFAGPIDALEFIFYHDSAAAGFIAGGSFTVTDMAACAATERESIIADIDGDGIVGGADLDEDNDGIPDNIEKDCANNTVSVDFQQDDLSINPAEAINNAEAPYMVGDAILTLDTPLYVGGAMQDEYEISNSQLNSTYAVRIGIDQTTPGPGQHVNTTYRLSQPVEDLCFFFNDLDRNDEVIVNGKLMGRTINLSEVDFALTNTTPDPACPVWQGNNTWRSQCAPPEANLNNSDRGGIRICFPEPVDEIEIIFYDFAVGGAQFTEGGSFSVSNFETCMPIDTDGDGIPDYLDSDSDNDGCPDAAEACHGLDYNEDGIVIDSFGENGLADSVEAEAESGVLNCTLTDADQDGIPDYIDESECDAGLPVELKEFAGFDNHCTIKLKWETATESNFSHFDIEKSYDGVNFQAISKTESMGNTATGANYEYIDENIKPVNYYRLKIVDVDGAYDYSNVIVVKSTCFEQTVTITDVYPNPVMDKLFIQMTIPTTEREVQAHIIDKMGRTVNEQTISITEGANLITIETTDLQANTTYFLRVQGENWITEVQKFIKAE